MADADAQAPEILGAEMRGDVLEAVVPGRAAALLELRRAGREVELVVHDQHLGRLDLVEARERTARCARSAFM